MGPYCEENGNNNNFTRNYNLSLLQYSFNLNIATQKQISIEMSQITTEHELYFKKTTANTRENVSVLQSQSIQRKNILVMKTKSYGSDENDDDKTNKSMSSMKNEINKLNSSNIVTTNSDINNYNVTATTSITKHLSELTVNDVSELLVELSFEEYKDEFIRNKIDGKCLMECSTFEEVKEMGMLISVKAKLFFKEIEKRKLQSNLMSQVGTEMDS